MSISNEVSEARNRLDRAAGEIQRVKILLDESITLSADDKDKIAVLFDSIDIVAWEIKAVRRAL
ncbi:MAG TPA: hypothetical protein PKX56_02745 [Marmoricola sp.]|nr:hypothetical protein [Marmoricola sp.]